jgi:hypothetical protein
MTKKQHKTMKTKQTQIEEAIREACPETMELKFGCKILVKEYNEINEVVFISNGSCKTDGGFRLFDVKKQDEIIVKILGTPLTLEHLLRAIEKKGLYFRTDGTFFKWEKFTEGGDGHHGVKSTYVTYDLTKTFQENMDNEELVEFLYKIICEK